MNAKTQWRNLSDLPNHEISNCGQIRNIATGSFLPICKTNNGYCKTNFIVNGFRYSQLIHRLVLREFIGPSDLQVNHIDGDKNNNALYNLDYVTQSENILHGFKIGLYNKQGENNPGAKLNQDQVEMIKALSDNGKMSQRKIAKLFDVSQGTISKIVNGKKWGNPIAQN